MEIGLTQAPEHRPCRHKPRQNTGEKCCRGAVATTREAGAFDLMQGRQRQAAPGQGTINRGSAKRQHRPRRLAKAFGSSQIAAQIDQPRLAGIFRSLTHNVLYLFFSFI